MRVKTCARTATRIFTCKSVFDSLVQMSITLSSAHTHTYQVVKLVDISLLQSLSYVAAAIGVCAASVYYMLVLRATQQNMKLTLEARKADILQRHCQISASQDFMDSWQDVFYNQNFLTYEEWKSDYGPHKPEHYTCLTAMVQYHEILGGLLKQGLVDIDLLEKTWQPLHVIVMWERISVVVKGWRDTYKDDSIYSNFEFLFDEYMRRHPEAEASRAVVREQFAERNKSKHLAKNP